MNSQDFFARFTASSALTAGWCPVGTAATPCWKANGTVAEINRQSPSRPRRLPINHKNCDYRRSACAITGPSRRNCGGYGLPRNWRTVSMNLLTDIGLER